MTMDEMRKSCYAKDKGIYAFIDLRLDYNTFKLQKERVIMGGVLPYEELDNHQIDLIDSDVNFDESDEEELGLKP